MKDDLDCLCASVRVCDRKQGGVSGKPSLPYSPWPSSTKATNIAILHRRLELKPSNHLNTRRLCVCHARHCSDYTFYPVIIIKTSFCYSCLSQGSSSSQIQMGQLWICKHQHGMAFNRNTHLVVIQLKCKNSTFFFFNQTTKFPSKLQFPLLSWRTS